ncbi:MAG TPA: RNA-binding transcriptional accessory protein [Chitinophagaceae bacterium]|nr:RNA-binding transcriptional accessory protein [Chitinophagaceae bacterium]
MFTQTIAQKLNIRTTQVDAVLQLLAEGSSIPFIARYRKDQTGALDEVQIQQIRDEQELYKGFTERKEVIVKSITEQGKMTDALQALLDAAQTITQLEDIYLPYKPKRKTKADMAKEKGLQPLAEMILAQTGDSPEAIAEKFLNEKVLTVDEALQGARDIIAEHIHEDLTVRDKLRMLFEKEASVISKVVEGKEDEAAKYRDYFSFSNPVSRIPSHRVLAILRGFLEGFLRISIEPAEELALEIIEGLYVKGMSPSSMHIRKSARDAYKRLLQPSLETEFRTKLKTEADEEAIQVFAENLRQLLLGPPLGNKRVLALDPGYRTGCKLVCLDDAGVLLYHDVIFPHEKNRQEAAARIVRDSIRLYQVQAIAVGDGTAGRETEQFIHSLQTGLPVFLVNEDGASVYSASETARREFPDHDITVRGAVSIGRRLMDPLAELVKIDPKSIGVGQYQHDVNQSRLKERLDQTVMSCVNRVGVNLHTASRELLSYVSGIGPTLAAQIVQYRTQAGGIRNRAELLKVPRLGEKAFEQCAGFLRIPGSDHPLDASAVHPESYAVVEEMAEDLGVSVQALIGNVALLEKIDIRKYIREGLGQLSIRDIVAELKKPGLDPRPEATAFSFAQVFSIEDLHPGMELPGIVTNLTRFGAFVDVGVKQDGLVHVSEIAHRFIKDPAEALSLQQQVMVKVLEVDLSRKRIVLSIKQTMPAPVNQAPKPKGKKVDQSPLPMTDALAALKEKFGR